MPLLKAIAPRIYIDKNPYVNRLPVFNSGVFYYSGSIVSKSFQVSDSDSDSVYYNFYVSKRDVLPGGLEPDVGDDWTIWVSGDPNLKSFYNDSDIYTYLDALQDDYQVYYVSTDSDLSVLSSQVNSIFGFDSDINEIKADIKTIEERNLIDSLVDSEASDKKAIAWDSDNQRFKFVTAVLSVNGTLPDANGNVSYSFTETKTGTRDDRLDSDVNGTIFVVSDDSDSDANGSTFAFTDSGWVRMVGYSDKENELLYVNTSGDTLTGPLILSRDPVSDSEAATKGYVDGFNDSDKQDKIIILPTIVSLYSASYENNRIYYVKENSTLWIYTSGLLKQFVIPGQRVFDPVLLEATAKNKVLASFDIDVETYRFSSFLPGQLYVVKNGSSNAPIIIQSNITGTYEANNSISDCKLVDSGNQSFTIKVVETFESNSTYRLVFVAHDGATTNIILGNKNAVSFSETNRTFNFGEY